MAKTCEICGKGTLKAAKRTFSNKKIDNVQSPNIQEIRVLDKNGHAVKKCVCTSCLRAGKVQKAI